MKKTTTPNITGSMVLRSQKNKDKPILQNQCKIQTQCIDITNIVVQKNYAGERNELEVNIDFDESSTAWRKNKRSIGNGEFRYI